MGSLCNNFLFGLTGIGALVLAGKAIYALTTSEGLTLHSGFFGMRTDSERQALEIKSDLDNIASLVALT